MRSGACIAWWLLSSVVASLVTCLFLSPAVPASAHVGDKLLLISGLSDNDLSRLDLDDGSTDDWQEVVGEPSYWADALVDPIYPYDPTDLDFRIWLAWHATSGRLYIAYGSVDDRYIAGGTSPLDHLEFVVDGDHSGGRYALFYGIPDEEAKRNEESTTQRYVLGATSIAGRLITCWEYRIKMLKLADNPDTDYKALVRCGYDRCAADYAGSRQDTIPPMLSLLIDRLAFGAAVLDIGCGAGGPVCRELGKVANVTGVDLSPMMILLARANVPSARFILADIMCAEIPAASLDAVTSFYAIFHLPKTEHEELFRRVYRWLKPGGQFLTTLSLQDEEPYTEDDFFGGTMYWSNYGIAQYREKLLKLDFTIEEDTQIESGLGKPAGQDDEVHPLIYARKAR